MRTVKDIVHEYLQYMYERTNDDKYSIVLFKQCDEVELSMRYSKVMAEILELCYEPKNGMYFFFKFILGDLTYAGYPEPIFFNKLWRRWSNIARSGDHIAIVSSRQLGKSTFWTLILPIYRIAMFKNYNILLESASEDQAMFILSKIAKVIEANEYLRNKKTLQAKWSSSELHYNGGKILAKGVGSEVRGGTYDLIIADDILRSDNKFNDADIESFVDEELEPMILVRRGQLIIVGTRMSVTDIFTTIEERNTQGKAWDIYYFPAVVDWTRKQLQCPDRFTWDQIIRKREVMGNMKFEKEFQCNCVSSGTQVFQYELRQRAMELGKEYHMHYGSRTVDDGLWYYYIGVDTARAGTASADYTVATVIAYNPTAQLKRIAWIWREKGLKISEQVQDIATLAKAFGYPPILVEKNNIGQEFIDLLIDNYNLNVESFTTTKTSKDDLIRFLITTIENGKLIFPTGDELSREKIDELNNEMDRFVIETSPNGSERMKGSGKSHDDMIISLALANKCSQSFGYIPFATSVSRKDSTELEQFKNTNDPMEFFRL